MRPIYKSISMMSTIFMLGACGGGSAPVSTATENTPEGNTPTTANAPLTTENTPEGSTPTTANAPLTTTPNNGSATPGATSTAPIAKATVTPATTTQGEVVTFDGSKSSDSNGQIVSYQWKEGSKILSGAASFTTVTLPIGTHTVALTVTDTDNEIASTNVIVTIKSASAEALRLMKTGQATSYASFDDGHYKKGVAPDYSRAKDVVTDHITGLQWQDDTAVENVTREWEGALRYCSKLKLDEGRWRLPTRKELLSIAYYTGVSPSIHPEFKHTTADRYYKRYVSSTIYAGSSAYNVWGVSFYGGTQEELSKTTEYYVRCVRNVK